MTQTDGRLTDPRVDVIRDLSLAIDAFRHSVAHRFHIGITESQALSHLSRPGALTPGELARGLGVAQSTVTSVVDRLVAVGAVTRSSVPGDRRRQLVIITPVGRSWLDWSGAQLVDVVQGLDTAEASAVFECMRELAVAIAERAARIGEAPPRTGT